MPRPFLTARWQQLVFLSYRCPPGLLAPHLPAGTVLDAWQGETYLSLVAFLFDETRLLGIGVPGHRRFEEVNLRFYVRRDMPGGERRRAVVFLQELVPRPAIALVARAMYNEPYRSVPMHHDLKIDGDRGGTQSYSWRVRGQGFSVDAAVEGPLVTTEADSLAEFITEHYWGYTRQRDGGTLEYRVDHPRWPVWRGVKHRLQGAWTDLYGAELGGILAGAPDSVLAAPGSAVTVYRGVRL